MRHGPLDQRRKSERVSGGLTPCWQLRPSSRRELVSASNSHVMGKKRKKKEENS